jgi:hypothetical protein
MTARPEEAAYPACIQRRRTSARALLVIVPFVQVMEQHLTTMGLATSQSYAAVHLLIEELGGSMWVDARCARLTCTTCLCIGSPYPHCLPITALHAGLLGVQGAPDAHPAVSGQVCQGSRVCCRPG